MAKQTQRSSMLVRSGNALLVLLIGKLGLNLKGAEVLEVIGRTSGDIRRVPVNPVTVGPSRYLMSPRGVTGWVRNIRASGEGTLRLGRQSSHFRVVEVPDAEKLPVLRAYLDRWHWQVGSIMKVEKDADDATLRAIAPNHPVFRIIPPGSQT